MPNIAPIRPRFHVAVLSEADVQAIQSATLDILDRVGVCFPSDRALDVFAQHGARVDAEHQVVKLYPELVSEAMSHAPRSYVLGARVTEADLSIDGRTAYMATDGCGAVSYTHLTLPTN